jgi:hypothetical protein
MPISEDCMTAYKPPGGGGDMVVSGQAAWSLAPEDDE